MSVSPSGLVTGFVVCKKKNNKKNKLKMHLGASLLSLAFWEWLAGRTDFQPSLSVFVKEWHVLMKCIQRCSQLA